MSLRTKAPSPARAVPVTSKTARHGAWLVAAAVVVAGLLAALLRPLAPAAGPPAPSSTWFDAAHLARARAYHDPRYAVGAAALIIRLTVVAVAAWTPPGRRLVARVVRAVGPDRQARAAAAVVTGIVVAIDVLLAPAAFWVGYLHEGAYGFRTQGPGGWLYDWTAATVPVWAGVAALTLAGYALARRLPRAWPPVGGLLAGAAGVALTFAGPVLLEPLEHRTTPLPAGPVRTHVERVLAAAGEPVREILVADASRRTRKQNAYVSGLGGTTRVVLWDTLLARDPAEVGVVVAHELGHQRHGDLWRTALLGASGSVVAVSAVAATVRRRSAAGHQTGQTDPRAAPVVVFVLAALVAASLPLQAAVSRRAEAAADAASLRFTGDPAAFLRLTEGLARANLADPAPPRWAYLLWYSHPSVTERLALGQTWGSAEGATP